MPIRGQNKSVTLRWSTQFDVELEGTFNVYRSAQGGGPADVLLTPLGVPAWPSPWDDAKRSYDDTGLGFGFLPYFGIGLFGLWAELLTYVTDLLSDGLYRFAVTSVDRAGNEAEETYATPTVILAGTPSEPESPGAVAVSAGVIAITFEPSEDEYS